LPAILSKSGLALASGLSRLLHNDVIADREPQTGAFACGLGRKERLAVAMLRRDAGGVIRT
jgi:hypothetical protein